MGQESQVNELLKDKDDLSAERDAQVEMIATLRAEVSNPLANPNPNPNRNPNARR